MARRSAPAPNKCVAKEWRSACGVAVSGRPSAARAPAILSWMMRGESSLAADADEQGILGAELLRQKREIALDRFAHDGQHWDDPRLVALPRHAQHVAAFDRGIFAFQPERFGDAQARAVKEREHGGIAREHPFRRVGRGDIGAVDQSGRLRRGERLRHRMRQLRQRHGADRVVLAVAAPLEEFVEHAERAQRSRQAPAADPLAPPRCQKGADIARRERDKLLHVGELVLRAAR